MAGEGGRLVRQSSSTVVLILLTLLTVLGIRISAADIDARNLLPDSTIRSVIPGDTLCCTEGTSTDECSAGASCAIDGNSSTVWTLKPRQLYAELTIQLNQSAALSDFSVSLVPSSVVPSSICVTARNSNGGGVTWTTYLNKSCQTNDTLLRKRGSTYYSCYVVSSGSIRVFAEDGLFSIRNETGSWFWWRSFQQFELTIEATDDDYGPNSNSSIAIADVLLFGWDEPNDTCNCHPAGVADVDSSCFEGNCKCRQTSDKGLQCIPTSTFALPKYGPISGGTKINASGNYLLEASAVQLGSGQNSTIIEKKESGLWMRAIGGDPDSLGSSLPVRISFERPQGVTSRIIADWEFTFRPDPVINGSNPRVSVVRGGIPQIVEGRDLDSVAFPFISIVYIEESGRVTYFNYTNSLVHPGDQFCRLIDNSSTMMECIAPPTSAPTLNPNIAYMTISVDIDKYSRHEKCEVADGKCEFHIAPNPRIQEWDGTEIYNVYNGPKVFLISGNDFNIYETGAYYNVTVGGVPCAIQDIATNSIAFYPPDASNFLSTDDRKQTVLTVGYFSYTVGYIQYYMNWIDNPTNQNGLIIGLIVGVGGLIIIILIIVLFRTYYKKKRAPSPSTQPERNAELRYTRPPQRNPGFLELLNQDLRTNIERNLIPFDKIQLQAEVGQGNFGKVFKGTYVNANGEIQQVAIKTLIDGGAVEFRDKVKFLEEATIMADFDHQNVLSLIAVAVEEDVPYVILPLMENGDLRGFVSDAHNKLTVYDLVSYSLQVAEGMEYLASRKFVHRDLAARNCMINKDMLVKVADFGLARDIFEKDYYRTQDRNQSLPVRWMAIECLRSHKFSESSDVWAYGILVWELLVRGRRPYLGIDPNYLMRYLLDGFRLEKPEVAPDFIYSLMLRCWKEIPTERPSFADIVSELKRILSFASTPPNDEDPVNAAAADRRSKPVRYSDIMRSSVVDVDLDE